MTDDELVKIALEDRDAFAEIIRRYKDRVYRYVCNFLSSCEDRSSEDAKDLTQEVFIKLYRSLARYREGTNFKKFLFSICSSVCIDEVRKRRIRVVDVDPQDLLFRSHPKNSQEAWLEEAIETLPQRQRLIIFLRYKLALSYKDISDILSIPLGSVKALLHRAIKTLKERLMEDGIL
jgi:RNA polymerase sigma-70 factor (ECF subfamily)